MQLVNCSFERHGMAILAILNDAIEHSTAIYEYQPRTIEAIAAWFSAKHAGNYPIIGWEDEHGQLLGFASYGPFRAFPAFKYTVEHAIYLSANARGRGLGKALLEQLIHLAQQQGLHAMIGAIDAENTGSIALHAKLGFTCNGILPQVGFKFGRWLDLALYQKTLQTPEHPIDG